MSEASTWKVLRDVRKTLEIGEKWLQHFPDLYGYRGYNLLNPGVFLLSPWEFLMWWEIDHPSCPTARSDGLTKWD
eukprot:9143651-Karenia_brevis.AAC.1